jgi:hypothetical protein
MKSVQLVQSMKRSMVAITLGCFLLIGAVGVLPKSVESNETATYAEVTYEITFLKPIRNVLPSANFWSG